MPCFSGSMARSIIEFFIGDGGVFSAGGTLYRANDGFRVIIHHCLYGHQ